INHPKLQFMTIPPLTTDHSLEQFSKNLNKTPAPTAIYVEGSRIMSTEQPMSVFDVRPRLEECFTRINKLLAILESSGEARHIIAATAELRRILQFSARTLDLALRAENRAAFEAEVIETLR